MTNGSRSIVLLGDERVDEVAGAHRTGLPGRSLGRLQLPRPRSARAVAALGLLAGCLAGPPARGAAGDGGAARGGGRRSGPQQRYVQRGPRRPVRLRPARAVLGAETWDPIMDGRAAAYRPAYAVLERAVPEPHWYLDTLAVEPARHGQGIGSRLLQAVHAQADADGLPIRDVFTFQPKSLAALPPPRLRGDLGRRRRRVVPPGGACAGTGAQGRVGDATRGRSIRRNGQQHDRRRAQERAMGQRFTVIEHAQFTVVPVSASGDVRRRHGGLQQRAV